MWNILAQLSNTPGQCCQAVFRHDAGNQYASLRNNQHKQTSQDHKDNSTKRKVTEVNHPTTYEEMLEQDVKTAKRTRDYEEELLVTNIEPSIVLGKPKIKTIRVSSLGPILKKRFIHPGLN